MPSTHIIKTTLPINQKIKIKIDEFIKKTKSNQYTKIEKFLKNELSIDAICDQDIIAGFDHDWSNMEGNADILCRPLNKEQCSILLYICNNLLIPVTISAGKTNLTGSATPMGGMIISIIRMNRSDSILVNNSKKTVSSSVGVYLEDLRNKVLEKSNNKLFFPVDPTSRKEAMVGGTISCNASGFIPGPKGAMRYWVKEIEFVLPSGEYINIKKGEYISKDGIFIIKGNKTNYEIFVPKYPRPKIKNASGPFSSPEGKIDLIDLIVGSEGIFGMITSCVLKLEKKPSDFIELFIRLKNEDEAFKFYHYVHNILDEDMGKLSAFEYFGENCLNYMVNKEQLFTDGCDVAIYMQIPVIKNLSDDIEKWYNIISDSGIINKDNQIISLNEPQNWKTFFEARHSMPANALEKARINKVLSIITDTIVPPNNFNIFIKDVHDMLKKSKIDYLLFGHLGDCHLHFHLIPNKNNVEQSINIYNKIIDKSTELGGVYSAEHGTGKRKKMDLLKCYNQDAVNQILKCKNGFDPNLILNQGNIV